MPTARQALARTQVTKKLAPDQAGAKKLTQRFGDRLVCVRYRQDLTAGRRYTTVELVVDEGPIPVDKRSSAVVHLRIGYDEVALQHAVRQHGGVWDRQLRAWLVGRAVAKRLRLENRVVRKSPTVDSKDGKD